MAHSWIWSSFLAFHANGISGLAYAFSTNWCLFLLVISAAASVVLGVADKSAGVIREEQNIL